MPPILRYRVALFVLLGAMLIPIGVSSLRGLTHVLTCEEAVGTPFALIIEPEEEPTVISAQTIERPEEEEGEAEEAVIGRLCGGLSVDLQAATVGEERVAMTVPITNHTEFPWQGTVIFEVGRMSIPVDIGEIAPGETGQDVITFRLGPGDHEVTGSLLIGP